MGHTTEGLKIDQQKIAEHLVRFIRRELEAAGFERLVLGISGGIDSTVVASLSARAVGAVNVTGIIMPYSSSNPDNMRDAENVIKELGIDRRFVDITPMIDAFFDKHPTDDLNRRGNKMARERMSILYDLSAEIGALVIGTSNRSEILMGYGTLFGDLACAFNPLGNLYKTQVRQLARYLEIPERIIAKAPSADLWQGQTDEDELGITYESLDAILYHKIDNKCSQVELEKLGYSPEQVKYVEDRIEKNRLKGWMPKFAELSD